MLEHELLGQESDINHACSAFGLGTVNYRDFPDNGPLPAATSQEAIQESILEPDAPEDKTPTLTAPEIGPATLSPVQSTEPLVSLTAAPAFVPAQLDHAIPPQVYAPFALQVQIPQVQTVSGAVNFQQQDQKPLLTTTLAATREPPASSARPTVQEAFGTAFAAAYIAAFGQQE